MYKMLLKSRPLNNSEAPGARPGVQREGGGSGALPMAVLASDSSGLAGFWGFRG